MKMGLLVLFAFFAAQVHGSQPVPTPLTATAGSETAYTITVGVKRLTIHPLVDVYMRTTATGPIYTIAANEKLVLEGPGMSAKVLRFEAASGSGGVEFFEEQ